jgi:quercetin dioxygenase-like cupin family protein
MHIKQVEKGDVVGIPKGVVFWWYNDGDSVHRIFSASDSSAGVHPGKYHVCTYNLAILMLLYTLIFS